MQLIPLELVKFNRDSVRKARKAYLIESGQTLEPHGLDNKKDETYIRFFCINTLCLGRVLFIAVHNYLSEEGMPCLPKYWKIYPN